ncbi:MAG: hypothetical protein Q7T28_13305 [Cypionkella sp.]|uniref:hypothetical protein n=1 Tax=Cypionkella sp. TaxID=2811411 RepID=UPI0027261A6A|nr:hypothetical protein [Cypionkella sp.]MDO8327902.1 hypothetical protein [Cypionkella sp.]
MQQRRGDGGIPQDRHILLAIQAGGKKNSLLRSASCPSWHPHKIRALPASRICAGGIMCDSLPYKREITAHQRKYGT